MGEGWGRHGRHPFGGEFGGRLFDSGELRLVILSYIAEKPSHGYEIMKGIGEQMGGVYTPSAGVVYPTLNQLEDEGFATVNSEGGKKQYTITEAGRAELASQQARIDQLLGRIRQTGETYKSGRTPADYAGAAQLQTGTEAEVRARQPDKRSDPEDCGDS